MSAGCQRTSAPSLIGLGIRPDSASRYTVRCEQESFLATAETLRRSDCMVSCLARHRVASLLRCGRPALRWPTTRDRSTRFARSHGIGHRARSLATGILAIDGFLAAASVPPILIMWHPVYRRRWSWPECRDPPRRLIASDGVSVSCPRETALIWRIARRGRFIVESKAPGIGRRLNIESTTVHRTPVTQRNGDSTSPQGKDKSLLVICF